MIRALSSVLLHQSRFQFARGDYKESGALYEEANKLAPGLRTFGVYYDDPNEVCVVA